MKIDWEMMGNVDTPKKNGMHSRMISRGFLTVSYGHKCRRSIVDIFWFSSAGNADKWAINNTSTQQKLADRHC